MKTTEMIKTGVMCRAVLICVFVLCVFVLILSAGCSNPQIKKEVVRETDIIKDELPSEMSRGIEVYFCPRDDCEKVLTDVINSSKESLHCAFFEINLERLIRLIGEKSHSIEVKLVVDNENYGAIKGPGVRNDTSNQYSHNKFCIIDNKIVTTGSMNPTYSGANSNNNLLIIHSKYLAENYEDEFRELWRGEFGKGGNVKYPVIYLNGREIENYFCPEDCVSQPPSHYLPSSPPSPASHKKALDRLIDLLRGAEKSIYFLSFSFTSEEIADALLFNKKAEIKGVFDKTQAGSKYSQYHRLGGFGLNVRKNKNKLIMHHKVFIIDNIIVITGSMNPSSSGLKRNDENIVIIHDKDIAARYVDEFEYVWNETA